MLSSCVAIDDSVVRRKMSDEERLIGRDRFLAMMRSRGYPVIENAGYFVVFCNAEPVVVVARPKGRKFLHEEIWQNPCSRILRGPAFCATAWS
jgi:hypothetical protein